MHSLQDSASSIYMAETIFFQNFENSPGTMDPLSVSFFDWHLCNSVGYTAYLKIKKKKKILG